MIKVLLIDDHKIVRDGLKSLLLAFDEIQVIGECGNGLEALEFLKEEKPDVILLDINMPEMNGIETATHILETYPKSKILALTMHSEESYISKVLKAGALGYVLKSIGDEELIKAIVTTNNGENYFSDEVSAIMMSKYLKNKPANGSRHSLATVEDLTEREVDVIKLISEEMTNNEIADKLFISPRTVDTHRRNLLQKLGVKNTAGLVRFAFENNLIEN